METRSNYVLVGAVTLALLAGVLLFIVWLAGLSNKATKCYDIYFAQGVGGLNKGSNVSFSGVPVGQIEQDLAASRTGPNSSGCGSRSISETPVLQGTTAQIKGVGFTGVSEIQLDGAVRGAPPITQIGPQGCPVIPASSGGLGALLNSAPELIDRIQRLTERLTELLSDKNQNAISDILENVDATTQVLAERAPDLADAIGGCSDRGAQRRHRRAAMSRALTDNTNRLVNEQGQPAAEDLRKAIASVQQAADNLERDDHRCPARRPEFQQVDAARGEPAGPRPARAVAVAAAGFATASTSRASAARSGPRSCPTTSRGNANDVCCCGLAAPIALALVAGACSLGGMLGGGQAAGDAADA